MITIKLICTPPRSILRVLLLCKQVDGHGYDVSSIQRHDIVFPIQADKVVPYFGGLFSDEPLPANGYIDLPNRCAHIHRCMCECIVCSRVCVCLCPRALLFRSSTTDGSH